MDGKASAGHVGRGALMGLADLVPGVSGGTVAFLLGIHPRLVAAIAAWDARLPRDLWHALRGEEDAKAQAREDLRRLDLPLLMPLGIGIVAAVLLGARAVEAGLHREPGIAMALFVGLIAASVPVPWRRMERRGPAAWGLLAAGTAATAAVAFLPGADLPAHAVAVAAAGFIAVTAMLLPGISGSGLLVILGAYTVVLEAAADLDWALLLPFAAGAVVGLMLASRVLRYLFARHHDATLAVLAGLLLGSVLRVWPWRSEAGFAEGVPLLPSADLQGLLFLVAGLIGAAVVVVTDRLARPALRIGRIE